MDLTTYRDLIVSGAPTTEPVTGLVGRIIRGQKPEDFVSLTDDPDRKIVMLVDASGLASLVGQTGHDMLVTIGYQPDYLRHKVEEGNQFKLVVFPEGAVAKLATWDNVLDLVGDVYPALAAVSARYRNDLKTQSFAEIEQAAGYPFLDVEKAGKADDRFMTEERMLALANPSLSEFRAFLYFTVHLREQYAGDGYTYDANGQRGVPEYIIPNKPLTQLGAHEVIDLDVQLPVAKSTQLKPTQRSTTMNVHLLVIDPQNDFMDIDGAALPVAGANDDMKRLAGLVDRIGTKLQQIHVTLDSHQIVDIAHPAFWRDANGQSPDPMTMISAAAIEDGTWTPRLPNLRDYAIGYAQDLETAGKYTLMVWPPHCLIGSWGHNVQSDLAAALGRWETARVRNVDYVTKGTNVLTEHYGALMAEVPIAKDPSTQLNGRFLAMLQKADMIAVAGEASSHCVKATIEQVADHIGPEHVKKFRLLTDCMSPVPAIPNVVDFPAMADQFLQDMAAKGMELTTSVDFLA